MRFMDNDSIEDLLKGIDNDRSNSRTSSDSDNSTVRDSTSEWSTTSTRRERDEQEEQGTAGSIQEEVRGLSDVSYNLDVSSDTTGSVYFVPSDSSDTETTGSHTNTDGLGGERLNQVEDQTTNDTSGRLESSSSLGFGTTNSDREESSGVSKEDSENRSTDKQEHEEDKQATELPELPKGITQDTVDRVASSAWLSHTLEGSVNVEFIKQNLPKNVYLPKGWTLGKVLLLPHVARKLEARGVPKPTDADILTPKQIQALVVITNARNMKWAARLKQAGVTVAEWQSWLKQPNFRAVYDKYAEGRLKDAIPEGITALSDKAADGDINAVKLVLEMTGRHDPNSSKEVNIQAILVGIVEILQQEVSDMETLMRVVNRIKGLQTGIGIGTGNIKGEIE